MDFGRLSSSFFYSYLDNICAQYVSGISALTTYVTYLWIYIYYIGNQVLVSIILLFLIIICHKRGPYLLNSQYVF